MVVLKTLQTCGRDSYVKNRKQILAAIYLICNSSDANEMARFVVFMTMMMMTSCVVSMIMIMTMMMMTIMAIGTTYKAIYTFIELFYDL